MIIQTTRVILALLFVSGLATYISKTGFFRSLLKQSNRNNYLKVHERLKISSKAELILVSVDSRMILLGIADGKISPFPDVELPDLAAMDHILTDRSEIQGEKS